LEGLGFAIRIWRSLISAISGRFDPLSPEAMTLKLQGLRQSSFSSTGFITAQQGYQFSPDPLWLTIDRDLELPT
jgi:hypothetical protein